MHLPEHDAWNMQYGETITIHRSNNRLAINTKNNIIELTIETKEIIVSQVTVPYL